MKLSNLISAFALFLAIGLISFTKPIEGVIVDVTNSVVNWKGYKVTGSHEGTIGLKSGELTYAEDVLTGGNFTIDMTSLSCSDLEGEYKGKLEGHLQSPDFFNVAEFPAATFNITKVAAKGTPGDYKVTGDLTIKGITKSIKFYAHVESTDSGKVYTSDITIDRTEFDVRYGSGSFFDSLGDKTIYDEFELNVKLVTK